MEWSWGLTAGILAILMLLMLLLSSILLTRVIKKKNITLTNQSYQSKLIFFVSVIALCIIRVIQYLLLFYLDFAESPHLTLQLLLIWVADVGAAVFVCIYGSLLVFWFSFVNIMRYREASILVLGNKNQFYVSILQIILAILCLIDFVCLLTLYANEAYSRLYTYRLVTYFILLLVLFVEGILFLVVGFLLGFELSRRSVFPWSSLKVLLLAISITVVYLYRCALTVYSYVILIQSEPEGSEVITWEIYSPGAFSYFIYYFFGEVVPVFLMILFQAKVPHQHNETEESLQEGREYKSPFYHTISPLSSDSDLETQMTTLSSLEN